MEQCSTPTEGRVLTSVSISLCLQTIPSRIKVDWFQFYAASAPAVSTRVPHISIQRVLIKPVWGAMLWRLRLMQLRWYSSQGCNW